MSSQRRSAGLLSENDGQGGRKMRRPIVVGNWKMNTTVQEAVGLVSELKPQVADVSDVEIGVAPPFTALSAVYREISGTNILLCGQNLFYEREGAYTGEISPVMLRDVGCRFVILGHSERRQFFGETDASVNRKIAASLKEGLFPIVCVGESLTDRESGKAFSVVGNQIKGCVDGFSSDQVQSIVVAYEPIWAIGTGKTATTQQAAEMHRHIREKLGAMFGGSTTGRIRIQYGGSVKPENIVDLMEQPDVDGALVGGASLKSESFSQIVNFGKK
jgi:triosephosphate isomerase